MQTKNARAITAAEREHLARVKGMRCAVCDELPPSDAHHIKQGQHYTTVPLCKICHTGPIGGWHGERAMWKVRKMDEVDALAVTIERLMRG